MPRISIYKFYRPLIVISCILGDVALNIRAKNSDDLFVQYRSWTTLLLVLKLSLPSILWVTATKVLNAVSYYDTLIHAIVMTAIQIWMFATSKHIALSLQAIDRMRAMIDQLPQVPRPQHCNPTQFVWIIFTVFLVEHVSMLLVPWFYVGRYDYTSITIVLVLLLNVCTVMRRILTLSTLFYSFSLIIKECFDAFGFLVEFDAAQSCNLKAYSTMLFTFNWKMKDIYRVLGGQVLALLIQRICFVVNNMLFYTAAAHVESTNLFNMSQWSLMFAVLIICMGLSSAKVNMLKETIIRTPINALSKRDCIRIKALLSTLHHSEEFTSVGFVTVNKSLFLSLMIIEIDYFITLQQNMTFLKQLIGLEDLRSLTNTTLTT